MFSHFMRALGVCTSERETDRQQKREGENLKISHA